MKEENIFTCKIGRIGAEPKSYHIIVPKRIIKNNQIKTGDILRFAYIGKGNPASYPFVDGVAPKGNQFLMKEIEKARELGVSERVLAKAKEEASHFYTILSYKQRSHTFTKSIAATSVYVATVNLGERLTQVEVAYFYGITEVTIRNTLHKVWKWHPSEYHLIRKDQTVLTQEGGKP